MRQRRFCCRSAAAGRPEAGAVEARREREVTIGEVLPSLLLLAGLLQVVGDAIMRSRSGSQ